MKVPEGVTFHPRKTRTDTFLLRRFEIDDNLLCDESDSFSESSSHFELCAATSSEVQLRSASFLSGSNQPLFNVKRGSLVLRGIRLHHSAPGCDIWNGNSALQVTGHKAKLCIKNCEATSTSGRGMIVQNGAHALVEDSAIHKCSATGIYVVGSGNRSKSALTVISSDICANGAGHGSHLGRGHSGLCLAEHAQAHISHSNLCHNSAYGVVVVSDDKDSLVHTTKCNLERNGAERKRIAKEGTIEEVDSSTTGKIASQFSILHFESTSSEWEQQAREMQEVAQQAMRDALA